MSRTLYRRSEMTLSSQIEEWLVEWTGSASWDLDLLGSKTVILSSTGTCWVEGQTLDCAPLGLLGTAR